MTDDLAGLPVEQLREAVSLLGGPGPAQLPSGRAAASRALRELMDAPGHLRDQLVDAPAGAADAFTRLVREGPLSVEALLGRGWWGRGLLPPPLDWLQRRAMVVVAASGRVRATGAAARGWRAQQLELPATDPTASGAGTPSRPAEAPAGRREGRRETEDGDEPVVVEAARCVVIADDLTRVLAVPEAGLTAVAPTVAVSRRERAAVQTALRAAGVRLRDDEVVDARSSAPALPGSAERGLTPWDIRALLRRGVDEARQVHLEYFPSSRGGAPTERTVDPWTFTDDLLVGWCHLRAGERTFALDRVGSATLLASALDHPPPADPSPAPTDAV